MSCGQRLGNCKKAQRIKGGVEGKLGEGETIDLGQDPREEVQGRGARVATVEGRREDAGRRTYKSNSV